MLGCPPDQTPPWEQAPPDQAPPKQTPPLPVQCMLGDMVNKWAVRILLECNLVSNNIYVHHKSTNVRLLLPMHVTQMSLSPWIIWLKKTPVTLFTSLPHPFEENKETIGISSNL